MGKYSSDQCSKRPLIRECLSCTKSSAWPQSRPWPDLGLCSSLGCKSQQANIRHVFHLSYQFCPSDPDPVHHDVDLTFFRQAYGPVLLTIMLVSRNLESVFWWMSFNSKYKNCLKNDYSLIQEHCSHLHLQKFLQIISANLVFHLNFYLFLVTFDKDLFISSVTKSVTLM